jgi:very-short-patch-repair endonuclease
MRGGSGMTRRARWLRRNTTDAERALWRGLRDKQLGARFRRQYPIPPYIVDFACVEARLIVEADGSQHRRAGADVVRDSRLASAGWRVLRFWDNDILQNLAGVLQIIAEALASQSSREHHGLDGPHPNPPPQAGEGAI